MKIVFTIGKFDCLHLGHYHLINEMRKLAMPNGKVVVLLYDDYPCFLRDKKFPIQSRDHRINNLKFLVSDVSVCYSQHIESSVFGLKIEAERKNAKLIYAGANKDIPEIEIFKKEKIQIRIINKKKL